MIYFQILLLYHVIRCIYCFNLTILHTNDVHSHYDEINEFGTKCLPNQICYGGISRRATEIKRLKQKNPNTILLDGGDILTRSLWYLVYRGNTSSAFLNELYYDAVVPGNHEFDDGPNNTYQYFKAIRHNTRIISSNMNISDNNRFNDVIDPHIVLNIGERKLGICGYTLKSTSSYSNPGPAIKFLDEVASVRKCAKYLTSVGVNIIIALGHAGIDIDVKIAQEVVEVDVVVGGHTDTFLYTGTPPSIEKKYGSYPLHFKSKGKNKVVVQAFRYGKYLGYLSVSFNNNGDLLTWSGNPILLKESIQKDDTMEKLVNKYKDKVTQLDQKKLGRSIVPLTDWSDCSKKQCLMGNFLCDSVEEHILKTMRMRVIVLWASSSITAPFTNTEITFGELYTAIPYQDSAVIFTITGQYLIQALKISFSNFGKGEFLMTASSLKLTYALDTNDDAILKNVQTNLTDQFIDINPNHSYQIAVAGYIYNYDTYSLLRQHAVNVTVLKVKEIKMVENYLQSQTLVNVKFDKRLTMKSTSSSKASTMKSSIFFISLQVYLIVVCL